MIGSRLNDRYIIEAELGHGGLGTIYRARDEVLQRQVAVKVLSNQDVGPMGRARLLNEARAAARLNHPNIVSIFDAGETPYPQDSDRLLSYIVMELVEGETLHDLSPHSIPEIVQVMLQVCDALEAAHQEGIIHRDLKPENVLITSRGVAKLTDFGLARSLTSRMSQENLLVGTVFYLAPELALGQPVDARTDLYALGVMLYEMCAGRLPFTADDPLLVISQHIHAAAIPPLTYNPAIPAVLNNLILRLMEKDPANRPSAVSEVRASLLETLQAAPAPAQVAGTAPKRLVPRGRMAGREREFEQVRNLWLQITQGSSERLFLMVSGEAGVGKTPFIREVSTLVETSGGRVLKGECYPETSAPYSPLLQMLQSHRPTGEFVFNRPARVRLEEPAGDGQLPSPDPRVEQQRLVESVTAMCLDLAVERPLLLVVEDVQWADAGTLNLLQHLARAARATQPRPALMIVLTYRPSEQEASCCLPDMLVNLNREHLAVEIHLGMFNREQTAAMLTVLFNEPVSPEVVDAVYRVTEGNFFFIIEVAHQLVEESALICKDGRWQLAAPIDEIHLPETIRMTIQARVSKLPARAQDVLRLAAVIGREFNFETLHQVSDLDENELIDALEAAGQAALIEELRTPDRKNGQDWFRFVHALIHTSLRDSLSSLRRRRVHRRVADFIASHQSDDYEALAYHLLQAGDQTGAAYYAIQAGERSLNLYANQEASRVLAQALELELSNPERARTLALLGEALFRQDQYVQAYDLWQEAARLSLDIGDLDHAAQYFSRAARAVWYTASTPEYSLQVCRKAMQEVRSRLPAGESPETPGMARLLHEMARSCRFNGLMDEALPLCRQALEMAEHLQLIDLQADVNATLGILSNIPTDEARAALERALELSESAGLLTIAMRAHENMSDLLDEQAHFIDAREHKRSAALLSKRIGMSTWQFIYQIKIVEHSLYLGDLATAQADLHLMRDLTERNAFISGSFGVYLETLQLFFLRCQGYLEQVVEPLRNISQHHLIESDPEFCVKTFCLLGDLLVELDRLVEAETALKAALAVKDPTNLTSRLEPHILLSGVLARRGELEKARQHLLTASSLAGKSPTPLSQMWLERGSAVLLAALGNTGDTMELYQHLSDQLDASNLRWLQARVQMEKAAVLTGLDITTADSARQTARTIFQQMGAEGYLQRLTTA